MSIYAPYNFVPLSAWIFKQDWTCNVLEIASFGKMRWVEDQWLSVRDLTGKFYKDKLSQQVGQNTYRPMAPAGFLKLALNDNNEYQWQLTPCDYARVEHNDLIEWGREKEIKNPENIKKAKDQNAKKAKTSVNKYRLFENSLDIQFELEGKERWQHGPTHRPLLLEYKKAKRTLGIGEHKGQIVFTGQPAENDGKRGRKHMEFIFYNRSAANKEIDETVARAFQQIHADSEEWHYWYDKLRTDGGVPVFYLEKAGKIESLGLAMMYRLPYQNSVGEIIKHTNQEHFAW